MKKSDSTDEQSASELIDQRIAGYEDWRGQTLGIMRKLVLDADPDVVEEVKWRKPSNSMLHRRDLQRQGEVDLREGSFVARSGQTLQFELGGEHAARDRYP